MLIYDALKKDHEGVLQLLSDLIAMDGEDSEGRDQLIQEIRDELIPHSRAEESIFYNSLRAVSEKSAQVMHGYGEHIEAESLLRALQVASKAGTGWKGTAKKLKEALEHHIHEEETEIFSLARKHFSVEEAKEMGKMFEDLKPQIRSEGIVGTSADLVVNLLPTRLRTAVKKFSNPNHSASRPL